MNKLLKQLVQVLDERGIQVSSLNMVENTPGYTSIEVNKEISIEDRGIVYSFNTKEGKLSPTNYYSLTEALEIVANYLGRVKEGTILYSNYSESKYKVVKHGIRDLYNLLSVNGDKLLFLECESISHIEKLIKEGQFRIE